MRQCASVVRHARYVVRTAIAFIVLGAALAAPACGGQQGSSDNPNNPGRHHRPQNQGQSGQQTPPPRSNQFVPPPPPRQWNNPPIQPNPIPQNSQWPRNNYPPPNGPQGQQFNNGGNQQNQRPQGGWQQNNPPQGGFPGRRFNNNGVPTQQNGYGQQNNQDQQPSNGTPPYRGMYHPGHFPPAQTGVPSNPNGGGGNQNQQQPWARGGNNNAQPWNGPQQRGGGQGGNLQNGQGGNGGTPYTQQGQRPRVPVGSQGGNNGQGNGSNGQPGTGWTPNPRWRGIQGGGAQNNPTWQNGSQGSPQNIGQPQQQHARPSLFQALSSPEDRQFVLGLSAQQRRTLGQYTPEQIQSLKQSGQWEATKQTILSGGGNTPGSSTVRGTNSSTPNLTGSRTTMIPPAPFSNGAGTRPVPSNSQHFYIQSGTGTRLTAEQIQSGSFPAGTFFFESGTGRQVTQTSVRASLQGSMAGSDAATARNGTATAGAGTATAGKGPAKAGSGTVTVGSAAQQPNTPTTTAQPQPYVASGNPYTFVENYAGDAVVTVSVYQHGQLITTTAPQSATGSYGYRAGVTGTYQTSDGSSATNKITTTQSRSSISSMPTNVSGLTPILASSAPTKTNSNPTSTSPNSGMNSTSSTTQSTQSTALSTKPVSATTNSPTWSPAANTGSASYSIPGQNLTFTIPADGQVFRGLGDDGNNVYVRVGSQIKTYSISSLVPTMDAGQAQEYIRQHYSEYEQKQVGTLQGGWSYLVDDAGNIQRVSSANDIMILGKQRLAKQTGIDWQGLPVYNMGDVGSAFSHLGNGSTAQPISDPKYLLTVTPPNASAQSNYVQSVSPNNPQGAKVTTTTGQVVTDSPSLAENLARAGGTPAQIQQATTQATQGTYTTPNGATITNSGQVVAPAPAVSASSGPKSSTATSAPNQTPTTASSQSGEQAYTTPSGAVVTSSGKLVQPPPTKAVATSTQSTSTSQTIYTQSGTGTKLTTEQIKSGQFPAGTYFIESGTGKQVTQATLISGSQQTTNATSSNSQSTDKPTLNLPNGGQFVTANNGSQNTTPPLASVLIPSAQSPSTKVAGSTPATTTSSAPLSPTTSAIVQGVYQLTPVASVEDVVTGVKDKNVGQVVLGVAGLIPADRIIIGGFKSAAELLKAGRIIDEFDKAGELTKAGRALEKHGSRPGTSFPLATGNAAAKNAQGQQVLEEILGSKNQLVEINERGGRDIYDLTTGRGVSFGSDGKMVGFLEYSMRK